MTSVESKEIFVFDDQSDSDSDSANNISAVSNNTNYDLESFYNQLLSMFPNVDEKYIRKICIEPPFNKEKVDNHLEMLVNHLLIYDERIDESTLNIQDEQVNETVVNDHFLSEILEIEEIENMEQQRQNQKRLNEQLFSEFLQRDQELIDEKMEILVNILPDADPDFLKKYIEEHNGDNNSLQQFVESKFIDRNYEKRDQYYARVQSKQKIEQFTIYFDVAEFINLIPDPFDHFENPERKGTSQEYALKFLKNRFNDYPVQEVEKIYSANNYNLSLADKHLQRLCPIETPMQFNIDTDDTPLLQEIAFIQNKVSIRQHLELIKRKREKEMSILRAQKLLLECQCCYDEMNPIESVECDRDETHIFCLQCIVKGTNVAISNGETSVKCFKGCNVEIPLNILRKILPLSIYDALAKKRQEMEVMAANLNDLVTCPFCPYSMELPLEIKIFTCKNPQCMKITCRFCKKKNHLPIKCEDVLDEHKGRLFIEEEMSKALIRYCHNCQKPFIKLSGCNKMQCHCGAMMCYLCKKPIIDYAHFDLPNGCGANQDSLIFDQHQVELRRIEATTKLHQDFPDLEIPRI